MSDATKLFDFTIENLAKRFDRDADTVYVAGHGTGGTLAASLALRNQTRVKACVCVSTCFSKVSTGLDGEWPMDLVKDLKSPVSCEFMVIHGTIDLHFPYAEAKQFCGLVRERKGRVAFIRFGISGHGFGLGFSPKGHYIALGIERFLSCKRKSD